MYYSQESKKDDLTIKTSRLKPRAKAVNDVLLTRKAGRMNDKDVGRHKDEQALRKAISTFDMRDYD